MPTDVDKLKLLVEQVIRDAVGAWKLGKASDTQAMFLDACLRMGILSNSIDSDPTVQKLVDRYRALESELPIATRVPGLEETQGVDQPLMIRGNHKTLGEEIKACVVLEEGKSVSGNHH